jgi:transcriptional regulator with PAS, ATPase and Fis domain
MNDNKKTKEELVKEIQGMRKLFADIEDEHLRTDELIFQSVYSWEDTFNNITDMITVHDKDFNIIHANKAAEKILDLPLLKNKKAKCYEHYHGEGTPPKGCPSCECLKTEKPVAFEKFEPHLNKFLEIRAMPQFDGKKQLIGVIHIVRDITERKRMEDEITSLKKHLLTGELENEAAFSAIITRSKKMRAIFQYIESVAQSHNPVLITGETGVGKELLARSVHQASGLNGHYAAVNIAGLDDNVFSDTLFGHRKGAYTGADKEREGLIVQAKGGTLLLDEIGDLSEISQVKLLRLLEDETYYPLGADIPEKSDARIVASSNRDIESLIEEGGFRKDLFYRLCTHHIHIPPLRERLEDIPLLLDHFLEEASKSLRKSKPSIPSELVIMLSNYNFPGNVRELKAMVDDAIARHKSGRLSLDSFKGFIKQSGLHMKSGPSRTSEDRSSLENIFGHFPALKEIDSFLISEALKRSDGNQGIAASLLGITRQALNQRLKKKNKQ